MKFMHEAVCRDCDEPANQDQGFLPDQRAACRHCGSIERKYPQLAKSHNGKIGLVLKAKISGVTAKNFKRRSERFWRLKRLAGRLELFSQRLIRWFRYMETISQRLIRWFRCQEVAF